MSVTRIRSLLFIVLAVTVACGLAAQAAHAGSSARRPTAEIVGFRAAGGGLVDPGGTIKGACNRRWLAAYVAFKNVRQGQLVLRRWRFGGKLVKGGTQLWEYGSKRRVVRFQVFNPDTLPGGRYKISVKVAGGKWASGSVRLAC